MEHKKILITSTILCLSITGYICYGFVPLKTYYPNGQLQSEAPRKFYKKEGTAFEYYENGQLKMETPYKNNLKNGVQVNHFQDGIRLETPYINGKKEGIAKLTYSSDDAYSFTFKDNTLIGEIKSQGNTIATIDENRQFSIQNQVKGKLICDDLEFIQNITVQDKNKRLMGVAKCVAIENFEHKNIGNPPLTVQFNGAFQYPKFTKTTIIHITDENHTLEKANPLENNDLAITAPYLSELTKYSQHYFVQNASITVDENNKNIYLKGFNKNKNKLFEVDFESTDISSIIENLYKYSETEKEEFVFEALRKLNISKYLLLTPQGKKNAELIGKIGFNVGLIENGTHFDLFSAQEKSVLKFIKIAKGFSMKIAYPNGDKDFFTADIKIDCPGLDELFKKINNTNILNEEELEKFKKSINPFSLIPNSISIHNLNLKNHDGETVLSINNFVIEPLTQSVTGTIQLSHHSKPYRTYNFKGDSETVEMVADGKTSEITVHQIPETISDEWIYEQRSKIAEPWIQEAKEQIENENKTSLTFAYLGGISGYNQATNRFDSNTIIDILNKYATLLEKSYEDYATKNNSVADFSIPTLNQLGINESINNLGVEIKAQQITNEGIEFVLLFNKEKTNLCHIIAQNMESECAENTINYTYPSELIQSIFNQYSTPLKTEETPNETTELILPTEDNQITTEEISSTEDTKTAITKNEDPTPTSSENGIIPPFPLIEAVEIKSPVIPEMPTPSFSTVSTPNKTNS